MKSRKRIFLAVTLTLLIANLVSAGDIETIEKENEELKERVTRLENELAELKQMIMQQQQLVAKPQTVAQEPEQGETIAAVRGRAPMTMEEVEQIVAVALAKEREDKKPVLSSLDMELYGYIKADASYDNSRAFPGNFILWADRASSGDNEFNLTANQTRLGARIKGPEVDDHQLSGRIEVDFYGNGAAENKPGVLVRHAYMTIDWPDDKFSLLAGQTSDVFSPLFPSTLNYTVLWDAGNIGYRHPQIRLTKGFDLDSNTELELAGAISRTIGDDEVLANGKSGEDAGFPTLQGRAGLTFPWFGYKPTTLGFSGHWGKEDYNNRDATSYSLNLDMTQPVNEWLTIKGEMFVGENLNDYFGGIGQGVNATMNNAPIGSRGGWLAASITPGGKWNYNLGFGIDDVEDDDLDAITDRSKNRSIFANAIYSLDNHTKIGFELSHWRTDYWGNGGDAEDIRAQTSLIYSW